MLRNRAFILLSLLLIAAQVAAQAHKAHAKHASATHNTGASRALIGQLSKYYRIHDSGWPVADLSLVMSRTTADYCYVGQDGQAASRDQVVDLYTRMLQTLAEKDAKIYLTTRIISVKLSGNKAIVVAQQKARATRQMDAGDGDTASRLVQGGGFRVRDTWVHLSSGWYLAYTEDQTMDASVSVKDHLNGY